MEDMTVVMEKIKKLWTKATDRGVTENEAAVFTQKVHELLARYNLDLSAVEGHEEERGCIEGVGFETGSLSHWQSALALKVGHLCLSECFIASGWNTSRNVSTKRLVFVGTKGNVAMAKALLSYLLEAIPRIRKEEQKKQGIKGNLRWVYSFDAGCANRLLVRIGDILEERTAGKSSTLSQQESTALVVVAGQELSKARAAMMAAHPTLYSWRAQSALSSSAGYAAGYRAGDRIVLDQQPGQRAQKAELR